LAVKNFYIPIWILLLITAGWIISRTPITTDMSAFLPESPTSAQQVLVDQLHDGIVSRLMLIGIEGAPPETLARISKTMAKRLRADPAFTSVDNGEEASFDADRAYLWNNRYALSPAVTAGHFSAETLHRALERDMQALASDMAPLVKRALPHDPTGEIVTLVGEIAAGAHPAKSGGVWVSPDFHRALLLAQTKTAGFDIDAQEAALNDIKTALAEANKQTGAAATMVASGPGVFAVERRAAMKRDTTRFSVIATVLVSILLLAAYRSPRILVLALLPVATGALAGIAAVSLGFGFVHGITLGFGVTLIGEAVDYAIYLFTQSEAAVTPGETLRRLWPTLRLGMMTSVCGFGAMLFSSFAGFAQLGLFTIVGLIAAAGVTRFVLPYLLKPGFNGAPEKLFARVLILIARWARRLRGAILFLVIAALATIALHRGPLWDQSLASVSPLPPAEQALDQELRGQIGAPDVRFLVLGTAPDREQALQLSERLSVTLNGLVAEKALAGYDAPSEYLPSESMQALRRQALPDDETLRANFAAALPGEAFKPELFSPFFSDVAAARTAAPLTRDSLDGTGLALKVDSLLLQKKGGWTVMLPLRAVADPARVTGAIAGAGGTFINLKTESDNLLRLYRHEAIVLSVSGAGAICLLLVLALRSFTRAALVLAPLGAAVIVVMGVLTFGTHTLSIFNLFGLLLTVAVGSNYCLFFEGLRHNKSGEAAGERTLASLVLANLCTVAGFGVLSFSPTPVLHGIGGTVALGAFLSLIFGAVLIRPRAS
jgi:predicted exporter